MAATLPVATTRVCNYLGPAVIVPAGVLIPIELTDFVFNALARALWAHEAPADPDLFDLLMQLATVAAGLDAVPDPATAPIQVDVWAAPCPECGAIAGQPCAKNPTVIHEFELICGARPMRFFVGADPG
jgi:hypothetical protein